MEEEMGIVFVEPVVPRIFEEVKSNIFKTVLPSWKQEDSEKKWNQEGMKRTTGWEKKGKKEKIVDSQMEDKETIQTINKKVDLEKWLKQGDNNMLKVSWRPIVGFTVREVDTEMKEASKPAEGLAESKHVVKQLLQEEIDKMAKEKGLEETELKELVKEMEDDKKEGRSDLFNAPQDFRNPL